MHRGPTGIYDTSTTSGEAVRAFVPNALPPVPPIELTGKRQQLLERANLACGRLDAITALLPDASVFLYSYVRQEAVLSSQIEGTQSSLSDLLLFELDEAPGVPFDDVIEVSNYVAALEHGIAQLRAGQPLSNRLLREVHGHLLSRGRGADKRPGEFRRSQNWLGRTRPGNAIFVPPPPHRVLDAMADLERFLNDREDGLPTLVRAGVAHLQFETIHPFLDGNGRVGRLLIALLLFETRVLSQPLLYLSLYLKEHRAEYYRLLDAVRREGDWEEWIDFFLEGVTLTAQSAVDTAHRMLRVFEEDAARVADLGRRAPNALRAFDAFRRRPVRNIAAIAATTGASLPTVSRAVESLVELGIVREITGRKRERAYCYGRYLEILNGGTVRAG